MLKGIVVKSSPDSYYITSNNIQSFWDLYLNKLRYLDGPPHWVDNFEFQLEMAYAQQLVGFNKVEPQFLPDFLIISPGKTGSTWLNYTLRCHPEIFIPEEKELKFFSTYWRWLDINWYSHYFQNAAHLKKWEVTPSYAILPSHIIQLIQALKPELKLIYLMRDPLDRAWSQAKHLYKYHRSLFPEYHGKFEELSEANFIQNLTNFGSLLHGDYLNSLQRWGSFFPKQQIFVGFYEMIKHDPAALLSDIFDFLEVKQEVDWSTFPLEKKFLASPEKEVPPNLKSLLLSIYKKRTGDLVLYLKKEFNLDPPAEWSNTLEGDEAVGPISLEEDYKGFKIFLHQTKFYALTKETQKPSSGQPATEKELEPPLSFVANSPQAIKCLIDQSLSFQEQLLTTASLGELFTSDPVLVESNYQDFNLVFYRGKFYALALALGHIDLKSLEIDRLHEYQDTHQCLIGTSLSKIKYMIDQLKIEPEQVLVQQELANLRQELLDTQHELGNLRQELLAVQHELTTIKSRRWFQIMNQIDRAKMKLAYNSNSNKKNND